MNDLDINEVHVLLGSPYLTNIVYHQYNIPSKCHVIIVGGAWGDITPGGIFHNDVFWEESYDLGCSLTNVFIFVVQRTYSTIGI